MPEMGQGAGPAEVWGWDGADPQRVYAGALGATIAATQYGLVTKAVLYGYDGTTLSRLKVEDSTNPNLRAALYYGAGQIFATNTYGVIAYANYGLFVHAALRVFDGSTFSRIDGGALNVDDEPATDIGVAARSCLYGFDGTAWDRLRTYGTGILKVARAECGLSNSGVLSGDTAVKGSAGKVFWITVSDTAALSIELNDSTDDGGTDLWAIDIPANGYCHFIFDPPIEFSNGIYLDVSTATCKVTIGYL